ncbi:MAG: PAS domain S-box protein, partial [Candidatus Acidiferrales bacterium]
VWPSAKVLAASNTALPEVALGMGLGLSWLLGLAVGLGQRARTRAEALAKEVHVRELAEEALEMSQSRYRVVTDTASDAIVSIMEDSRIVFANPAVEKVFGYKPGELRGKELTLLMPEGLRELHRAAIKRYVETGKKHLNWESIELTGLHKDGREIPVEVSFGEQVKKGRHIFTGIVRDITERHGAQAALRASEEKFRALAETAASAIFITREDKFLYLNRATEEILGYAPAELLGAGFWSVIHPEDRELVRRMRQARLEGQPVPERYEFRVVRKGGETRWVDFTATVVTYDSQQAVMGTAFDITERHRAVEALRKSEEHYRLLFEKNPHPMWVFDNETLKFLAVNEASVEQYGYTHEELLGMTIKDIRPAEEGSRLEAYLAKQPQHRGPGSAGVWRHRKKDGSVLSVEVTSEPLEFDGREARLVLAVDVTEKHRAGEALRKSEKMLAEAQRVAQLGSWEWDMVADHLYWSEETYRILGVTPEEVGGRMETVLEVVHPEDRERVKAGLEGAAREKKPFASEHRIVRPDGAVRVVNAQAEVSYDEKGRAERMVGIVHDITEQRRLEEQFQQAQKMEAVGRLAGGIAHDFNNLLMLIRGYSELMLEHAGADKTEKQYAREVIEAADRAAGLTQQLLAFSRKQVLEPRVVSMNEAVQQMEKMLRRVLGEDIELGVRRKAARPWVKVDPSQLEQVILNLALNARDAMPKGGLLTLETANVELDEEYARQRPEVQPGDYVMLAVSDTGAGMSEEVRAHAFDPFFTTKEKGKGTGLGLATVYGIVRQSGGNIWVYSEPGKGTTFKIYFPLVGRPVAEEALPEVLEAPAGTGTVLLAEDEERVRKLGRQFLEASGYRVLEATSVGEALELMAKHKEEIDVLMTDVIMPQMSGRELAERVVKMKPTVRVLYMSGYTDDVIVRHGELEAGTAFLQKPFTKEALARKLRELLGT